MVLFTYELVIEKGHISLVMNFYIQLSTWCNLAERLAPNLMYLCVRCLNFKRIQGDLDSQRLLIAGHGVYYCEHYLVGGMITFFSGARLYTTTSKADSLDYEDEFQQSVFHLAIAPLHLLILVWASTRL